MSQDSGRSDRLCRGLPLIAAPSDKPEPKPRRRPASRRPTVETLEGRQLLSGFFTGATMVRPVQTAGGVYTLSVSGPGLVNVSRLGKGLVGVTLYGTTDASTLNVALTRQKLHKPNVPLEIGSIRVISGTIGAINASPASLRGAVTPLSGVNTVNFGSLGPNARLDVNGPLANLGLGAVNLGPNGRVRIAGSLGQSLEVGGPFVIDGGQFSIGSDIAGALNLGSLQVKRGGQFHVGKSVTAASQVAGDVSVSDNGLVMIGQNLGGLAVAGNITLDTGGRIVVGNDLNGALSTGANFTVANTGRFAVGRDVTFVSGGLGGIQVGGNLSLATGGSIGIGRDLDAVDSGDSAVTDQASLRVNGDLLVDPSGGVITVGGNLDTLLVNGIFRGKGTTEPDLTVGLDLRNISVLGATPNLGGIQKASIDVAKNIIGLNAAHGIYHSFITAGVLIDNVLVGPDGADAVLNSNIRAGVTINRTILNGNVRSTFPTDPNATGYPTRIVAGQDRAGTFTTAGLIDNFQILGTMYDSVVAASVAPNGGDGTLPVVSYGAPPPSCSDTPGDLGNNTYDAPFGMITVGSRVFDNYTQLSYKDGALTGVFYNTTLDPIIDDCILPGSLNPSFAGAGLPTRSTVLGGVISTAHGQEADFAGLFAADTKGVFIGTLPGS